MSGAAATYAVTIRNPGNAAARNIKLSLGFPAGTRYLSGVEGGHQDAAGGRLEWNVETLAPEVEQSFAVKCTMGQAGTGQIRLEATADDDLVTSAEMPVRVQSVASLSMDVKDPPGPVPVGEEATYEIHVTNRGTREAQGVEVFAYFSHGIEPTAADGAPNRLGPGQVLFQSIPSLAPGAEVVLKVRAKAEVAGNHVFRAEAHCKPLGARLIREATNLYYGDTPAAEASRKPPVTRPPTSTRGRNSCQRSSFRRSAVSFQRSAFSSRRSAVGKNGGLAPGRLPQIVEIIRPGACPPFFHSGQVSV